MELRLFSSIQEIPEASWAPLVPIDFPFMAYHFLHSLETTNCLGTRTGWTPVYLTLWNENSLVAALASFIKNNSYGEYIFDFAWAQVHESSNLSYYPKLVAAVPFTPATGPKILFLPSLSASEKDQAAEALLNQMKQLAQKTKMSSVHALFITPSEIPYFEKSDFFIRESFQFHWKNENYQSFEDFLKSLRSKRRTEISRERHQVRESGIKIHRLTGSDLEPEHARLFYQFYFNTIQKMGGYNYLTPDFFTSVFRKMKDQILFVLATKDDQPVAGALNYFGPQTLFGRHWGCLEEYKSLHFELCYYQGIEFAIEKNLSLFEAGAQGEHKFQRGFLPNLTYSAHRIHDPQMRTLIQDHVEHEKTDLKRVFADFKAQTPFSRA